MKEELEKMGGEQARSPEEALREEAAAQAEPERAAGVSEEQNADAPKEEASEAGTQTAESGRAEAEAADPGEPPCWMKGHRFLDTIFARQFIRDHPCACINGIFYDVDGLIDENGLRKEISDRLSPWVSLNLAGCVSRAVEALKVTAYRKPERPDENKIHFANGTLLLGDDGFTFTPEKEITLNRLPVAYDPDAPEPETWKWFTGQLFYEEDIPAVQEGLGYYMSSSTKGQKMFSFIGDGGEGKSCFGDVCRAIFGYNLYEMPIANLEKPFCLASLENKLVMLDDDMNLDALPKTGILKKVITCTDKQDMERKNVQNYQGELYCRILGLGNGSLKSLNDRTEGFYRRQVILTVKPKDPNRVNDTDLTAKLKKELQGIVNWALAGLMRLRANGYRFTLSERAKQNLQQLRQEDDNIREFLKESSGAVTLCPEGKITSCRLYELYCSWCTDNLDTPKSKREFTAYLRDHAAAYGIQDSHHVPTDYGRRVRGYTGIKVQDAACRYDSLPENEPAPVD